MATNTANKNGASAAASEAHLHATGTGAPAPFFATDEQYQEFYQRFVDDVAPDLEKHAKARSKSEEEAKLHWVN